MHDKIDKTHIYFLIYQAGLVSFDLAFKNIAAAVRICELIRHAARWSFCATMRVNFTV
jgi:hypothetical protein